MRKFIIANSPQDFEQFQKEHNLKDAKHLTSGLDLVGIEKAEIHIHPAAAENPIKDNWRVQRVLKNQSEAPQGQPVHGELRPESEANPAPTPASAIAGGDGGDVKVLGDAVGDPGTIHHNDNGRGETAEEKATGEENVRE